MRALEQIKSGNQNMKKYCPERENNANKKNKNNNNKSKQLKTGSE